jgi:UDP:flavonoid glycosyltransferase YjiC (YdhE family)
MKSKMNILFVTIDGGGNLPPVLGMAKGLSRIGHSVTVLSEPCVEELINSLGYEFIPFNRHFTRKDRTEDVFKDWNASPIKNPVLDNIVFGPASIVAEETKQAIEKSNADILIADCLLPNALIAAEALGIPGLMAFHMPEYFPGPNRPPGMFGLKPGKGFPGRLRDKVLTFLFNKKLDGFLPGINEARAKMKLPHLERTSDLLLKADIRFIQTLEHFDFPILPNPANVRYTGPFLDDPDWVEHWANPWAEDDPRPLVVISLSSTFQNQQVVIQSSIDALRNKEIRGLVTLGAALDKNSFKVPENVAIVDSAPHSEVFPLADLVITHAGHGTVMRALSHGLPLICLPMGRDQNDNAIKVDYHGCGIALNSKAGSAKIGNAVLKVLNEESFRQNARRFQKDIIGLDPASFVARELDALIVNYDNRLVNQPHKVSSIA